MYYFIVNPNAGRGRGEQIWKKLERQLLKAGVEYKVRIVGKPEEAREAAHVLTEGCKDERVLIAVGGDGTVNQILNGISFGCPVSLGYILTDSDDDLARSLKLSKNPQRCLKKILNSQCVRYLDYGILTYGSQEPVYRRFAVSSGIGMETSPFPSYLEFAGAAKKKRFGLGNFRRLLHGICHILFAKPSKGYVILDGVKKIEFNKIYFVSCHIHPFEGGGLLLAPKADASDGLLDVCVAHHASKWRLVQTILAARLKRHSRRRGIHIYRCREAQIHLDCPMSVYADGECCVNQSDIHVRCVEKKLRMRI